MNTILRRRRGMMGAQGSVPLVNIVTANYPITYTKTANDYNGISTSEIIEPGQKYKIVVEANMPENVRPIIAMGPGRSNGYVYFDVGLNGKQTVFYTTPSDATFTEKKVYQRSSGQGSTAVTFTINKVEIFKV